MLTPRGKQRVMSLLLGSLVLRPYVFLFLLAFLVAGVRDLGGRRTALFLAWVWPLAFVAEFASTRIGIPFGLYHYTGATRGQELFLADVPFFDSLSFTFLAYASFCVARAALPPRCGRSPAAVAVLAGVVMMLLDVVIDPLAVRGDRWFLGRIFWYPDGGPYFGVPLSNFAGWLVVGVAGVGGYLRLAGDGALGRAPGAGVGLYYGVLVFNLVLTAWIQEWLLLLTGTGIHLALGLALLVSRRLRAVTLRSA
jgi:putative membrane protein